MTLERDDTRLAASVSDVPSGAGPLLTALTRLTEGDEVGRFRVRRVLGEGGMGLVYLAEDPQLGRLVAVKLLRPMVGSRAEEHQRRLLREAQVLARVAHRNLVTVYDVGVHGDVVFVAMEYVRGQTLDAWLKSRSRRWPEVLRTFLEAGQGLAAVHDAGLVHRDFKPGNVMVAEDGRVLILDFGLARPTLVQRGVEGGAEGAGADSAGADAFQPADDTLGVELTRAGGVMGTPAYMAPEQHLAIPADARADQFSFCVALYEALYGERPFWGRDEIELMEAVLRGLPKIPAAHEDLPLEVRRALARGLHTDRDGRFASMGELLAVLEAAVGQAKPERRWGRLTVAAVALIVFTAGVTWRLAQGDGDDVPTPPAGAPGFAAEAGEDADDDADDEGDRTGNSRAVSGASATGGDGLFGLPGIDELPSPASDSGDTGGMSPDLGSDVAPATTSAAVLPDPDAAGTSGGAGALPGIGDEASTGATEAATSAALPEPPAPDLPAPPEGPADAPPTADPVPAPAGGMEGPS